MRPLNTTLQHQPTELYRYREAWVMPTKPKNKEDDLWGWSEITQNVRDVICDTYPILKYTPCGYWIEITNEKTLEVSRKLVLKDTRIKYAHEIRKDALQSFLIRKKRQLGYIDNYRNLVLNAKQKAERLLQTLQGEG